MFGVHDQCKGKLFKNDYLKNQMNTASMKLIIVRKFLMKFQPSTAKTTKISVKHQNGR